jgi:hypothetical protein
MALKGLTPYEKFLQAKKLQNSLTPLTFNDKIISPQNQKTFYVK